MGVRECQGGWSGVKVLNKKPRKEGPTKKVTFGKDKRK